MPKARSDVYLVSSTKTVEPETTYDNTAFSQTDTNADNYRDASKAHYTYVPLISLAASKINPSSQAKGTKSTLACEDEINLELFNMFKHQPI